MWNVAFIPYAILNGIDPDLSKSGNNESANKNITVQCITIIGCAMGALCAGKFVDFGRWKCLIIANILIIIGCLFMLAFKSFVAFNVGRLLYGLAIGSFSVFSN